MAVSARRRWLGLVAVSLAVAVIIVDSTIVNVAVPYIVKDLALTSTDVQWVQESYTLVFAATLLVWGTVADRIGRRRMLLIGVVVFTLASLGAALAASPGLLIVARIVQGFGGAMILPTTLSLINATFTGRERGIAFAIWGSTIGGMVAFGPLLGGWLTTDFSWRWSFGINVPIAALIVAGVLLFVDESRSPERRRIDLVGAVLAAVAFASLAFGLIEGRTYGWWLTGDTAFRLGSWKWPLTLSPIPFAFALAVVAGAAFLWRSLRRAARGRDTLIDLGLYRIPSFRNGSIAAMIVSLGEFGIVLSLPLWLQNVIGYTAFQTGLVLLALAVGSFVASGAAAGLSNRLQPAVIVRVGIAAEIVGIAGLGIVIGPTTEWWALVPFLFVYGFGVGLATAQLTGVVLVDVPAERSGQASGAQSTARQVGSALGIAVLGTVLFGVTTVVLQARLEDLGLTGSTATGLVSSVVNSAGGTITELAAKSSTIGDAAKVAFSDGTRAAAFTAAGALVAGLAASFSLGGRRRDEVLAHGEEAA